ncbi:hypothetical protein EV191_10545 [Tamaricihabitans halophyticus]|uniref:Uncharacterized protein n=1 Tax=Tamaricihabitans halophyticus TaxID=1262583 RepID=A0A4R2QUQ7_9PSEU|nr:DUF6611 family protein [Tamaricihabitans halophyticus]TCP52984.1 hypothetical protein EV191_10545 [Tamaricihabitans halophyticus]
MNTNARYWQKLLDGRYRWGIASRQTSRYGARSIRLLIHPPDSSRTERRYARLARFWPVIGVAIVALKGPTITFLTNVSAYLVFAAIVALVVWAGLTLAHRTADTRARSVELFASSSFLTPRTADQLRYGQVARIAEDLDEAQRQLDNQYISWSWYQFLWDGAYQEARATPHR